MDEHGGHPKRLLNRLDKKTVEKTSANDEPAKIGQSSGVFSKNSRYSVDRSPHSCADDGDLNDDTFKIHVELDVITIGLFLVAAATRFYKIGHPNNIV